MCLRGGRDFPAYLSYHFPRLYSDYRLDYSSGSSRFLSALSSAPPLVVAPAAPAPDPFVSSSSLPSSFPRAPLLPSASAWPSQSVSSLSLPVASAPVPSHPLSLYPPLSSSSPALSSAVGFVGDSVGAPLAAGAGAVGVPSASSPLFRPFAPSARLPPPPPSCSAGAPPVSLPSASFQSASAFVRPPPAFGFVSAEDLPEDSPPDAVPRVLDPGFGSVPNSAGVEFCRMLSFIVDLFPQAAGSPYVAPPPRALFEDFFSSSAPSSSSPVFLNWFERVRSALSDSDSRLAGFFASGRGYFLLLPSLFPLYAVHENFALSGAVSVNSSLLALLDRKLKPLYHHGLSVGEAAALEGSLRAQSEALLHSMWGLSGLLAFVRLQRFAP